EIDHQVAPRDAPTMLPRVTQDELAVINLVAFALDLLRRRLRLLLRSRERLHVGALIVAGSKLLQFALFGQYPQCSVGRAVGATGFATMLHRFARAEGRMVLDPLTQ